jgi:hypothetical protein
MNASYTPTQLQGFDRCMAEEPVLKRPESNCNMYDKGCCYSTEMLNVNFGGIAVAVHKDMYAAFLEVAKIMAKHRYSIRSAGGFCCRCIRAGSGCSKTRSNHAFGVSIDVNPRMWRNRLHFFHYITRIFALFPSGCTSCSVGMLTALCVPLSHARGELDSLQRATYAGEWHQSLVQGSGKSIPARTGSSAWLFTTILRVSELCTAQWQTFPP